MNAYYHPEEKGLEIIWSIDTADSYEFDMFVIWKDKSGNLFYATDSGCSCPTPFDDVDPIPFDDSSFYNFKQALENHSRISREDIIKALNVVSMANPRNNQQLSNGTHNLEIIGEDDFDLDDLDFDFDIGDDD